MAFKDRLKETRIKKGLSQEDLAKMLGVSKQAVQKYESGAVTNVPLATVEKLAVLLDTTPAYLVEWDSKSTKPATGDGDRLLNENIEIFKRLNPSQQREVLRYLRYFASLKESD
jgi:transcriptional regulator with XRE-family HTH domain